MAISGNVVFNGVSSLDLHALVEHPPEYTFPEKEVNTVHIPGRSGDVILPNHSWKNGTINYQMAIDARKGEYGKIAGRLVEWLQSPIGYKRLEDSFNPHLYQMATYINGGSISNIYNQAGQIEVSFSCLPQRYLKIGERPIKVTNVGDWYVIKSPTGFPSKPILEIFGSGSFYITIVTDTPYRRDGLELYEIQVLDNYDGMWIDCEKCDVYNGASGLLNLNDRVYMKNGFPEIYNEMRIMVPDNVTVNVYPRWWTL